MIGVGGAIERGVLQWEDLLAKASTRFNCVDTDADDPALIIYTSGTTGPPKGALKAHRTLIGNVPGFVHSHDFFPRPGDMFWSPADWAWTGGLMDALLPSMMFGVPILGYRGRFDAEKAYYLIEKYGVRNSFLFPTALKLMMKAVPEPKQKYDFDLRSIMSAGESVGVTVFEWAKEHLGVTINEMFGQTEINYVVGNCQSAWPAKPGSIGRPYPGHRVAVIDDQGNELAGGRARGSRDPSQLQWSTRPGVLPRVLEEPAGDEGEVHRRLGLHRRPGEDGRGRLPLVPGPLRRRDQERGLPHRPGRDRELPGEASRGAERRGDRQARRHARRDRQGVHRSAVRACAIAHLIEEIQNHVRGRLAPYEYPREIEFIDALPMTTTGKVQRKELRKREESKLQKA